MEPDASLLERLLGIFLSYWPYMGMLLGPVLIIASQFRWRMLFQTLGVIILGLSIGGFISR